MEITLEKVDLVRERTGVTYAEAKKALEVSNGDTINDSDNILNGTYNIWLPITEFIGNDKNNKNSLTNSYITSLEHGIDDNNICVGTTYGMNIVNKKRRLIYKLITTISAVIFSICAIAIKNNFLSNCLVFAIIIENALISPTTYKLFKLPYNNYITFLKEHPDFTK